MRDILRLQKSLWAISGLFLTEFLAQKTHIRGCRVGKSFIHQTLLIIHNF
ncbi:uncharacterized protein DS421_1g18330 [Arachis hypogaea]|nr:uncharacterized protein DS421_1g18330 [Arachis hypogaea]